MVPVEPPIQQGVHSKSTMPPPSSRITKQPGFRMKHESSESSMPKNHQVRESPNLSSLMRAKNERTDSASNANTVCLTRFEL